MGKYKLAHVSGFRDQGTESTVRCRDIRLAVSIKIPHRDGLWLRAHCVIDLGLKLPFPVAEEHADGLSPGEGEARIGDYRVQITVTIEVGQHNRGRIGLGGKAR